MFMHNFKSQTKLYGHLINNQCKKCIALNVRLFSVSSMQVLFSGHIEIELIISQDVVGNQKWGLVFSELEKQNK